MPSPVGHILGGAAVYLAGTSARRGSRTALAGALLGSIVPDFDFIPGILIGDPGAYHHGISHSMTFAALFGVVVFLTLRRFQPRDAALEGALMAGFAYALHILLDVVSVSGEGRGVPIFWPLAEESFGMNLYLFGHFHHEGLQRGIRSVVRWDNLPALARELVVMGVPVLSLLLWRRRRAGAGEVRWEA